MPIAVRGCRSTSSRETRIPSRRMKVLPVIAIAASSESVGSTVIFWPEPQPGELARAAAAPDEHQLLDAEPLRERLLVRGDPAVLDDHHPHAAALAVGHAVLAELAPLAGVQPDAVRADRRRVDRGDVEARALLDHRVGVQVADVGHAGRVEPERAVPAARDAVQEPAVLVLGDAERRLGVADVEEVAVHRDHGVRGRPSPPPPAARRPSCPATRSSPIPAVAGSMRTSWPRVSPRGPLR